VSRIYQTERCHSSSFSGWIDPIIQRKSYVDFAINAPGYGQLQTNKVIRKLKRDFYGPHGCKAQTEACYDAGNEAASDKICGDANDYCVRFLLELWLPQKIDS
jgi:hypothetical protein